MVLAIESCHKHGFIHRDIKPDVGIWNNSTAGCQDNGHRCGAGVRRKLISFPSPTELFIRPGRTHQAERLRPRVSDSFPQAGSTPSDNSLPLLPHCLAHSTDLHWAHDTSCLCSCLPPSQRPGSSYSWQTTSNNACICFTSMASTSKRVTASETARGPSASTARRSSDSWAAETAKVGSSHGGRNTAAR